jgi:hypothetical protein
MGGIRVYLPAGSRDFSLPTQWTSIVFSQSIKWLGHETNHSPISTAKVNNAWNYTLFHTSSWLGL